MAYQETTVIIQSELVYEPKTRVAHHQTLFDLSFTHFWANKEISDSWWDIKLTDSVASLNTHIKK